MSGTCEHGVKKINVCPECLREIYGQRSELSGRTGSASACRCRSYNRPDMGGDRPEMILPKPEWSDHNGDSICVDACIADVIQMLWRNGIQTLGSCCGHNKMPPSVVIAESADGARTMELLRLHDDRQWDVMQWRLVKLNTQAEPRGN